MEEGFFIFSFIGIVGKTRKIALNLRLIHSLRGALTISFIVWRNYLLWDQPILLNLDKLLDISKIVSLLHFV